MSAPAETSDSDRRLRRPSDLRKEGTSRRVRPHRPDEPPLSWPERFVDSQRDRAALIILLHLASLTPRRLLELAQQNRTAAACLDAVAHGAKPWLQVTFPEDITVKRVTILGNRDPQWLLGYTILAGTIELLDAKGKRREQHEVKKPPQNLRLEATDLFGYPLPALPRGPSRCPAPSA